MKIKDFTTETLEVFSWLESELGCTREVTHFRHVYFMEKITYKKDNITITIVCDNRDYALFFEIFVTTQDQNLCISEEAELFKLEHVSEGQLDVEYESVFNYTKDTFNKK